MVAISANILFCVEIFRLFNVSEILDSEVAGFNLDGPICSHLHQLHHVAIV